METCKTNATAIEPSGDVPASSTSRVWQIVTLGDRLGRRTAVVVWLAGAIGLGLFLGWSWVVAAGVSSIVLGLLPCAAMCALGFCGGSPGKKCSEKTSAKAPPESQP
jgi:hypothetical protein